MPDIEKINNVAVADISKLDSITFAHGQKVNNQDVSLVTDNHVLISDGGGAFTNQSTVTFASLEQDTYNHIMFQFINIHTDTDDKNFRFASTDGNDDQLTTNWYMWNEEDGSSDGSEYSAGEDVDLDDGNPIAILQRSLGSAADESASGFLWLYGLDNDNSYVKHWHSRFTSKSNGNPLQYGTQTSGAILENGGTATEITGIEFTMESGGNFDGTIKLFGLAEAS